MYQNIITPPNQPTHSRTPITTTNSAHQGEVTSVSFAPSDAKFVSASDDQTLKIWDFARHEEEGSLEGHTWYVGGWVGLSGLWWVLCVEPALRLRFPRLSACMLYHPH